MKYKNNSRKICHIIKEITGKAKIKSKSLPKTIKFDNKYLHDERNIADELKRFFTSVGPNLASKIFATPKSFEEYLTPQGNQLESYHLSFEEFETAFKFLKRNK